MKPFLYPRNFRYLILAVLVSIASITSQAEGTKQFRPTSADVGNLEINDQGRPFALESNTDPYHRLYFHISNITEKVYFGFQHLGIGTGTFLIRDPHENIVYSRTTIPTSSNGYINTYDEAVAGPNIGGSPAAGYSPLFFQPTATGDFYMEFTTSLAGTYHFDLFDLTVTNSSNTPINGRLWSYAWDLSTRASSGKYNGLFYIYTDDGYVSKINMNGIQPWGFVVSCNNTGPSNLPDGNNVNRKSVAGNSTRPQYKIFLNDPDNTAYPNGQVPTITQNLSVVGHPRYGDAVDFTLEMTMGGTVQIVLDINGVTGYQANTSDLVIVAQVTAGKDTIHWDGKDGLGNFVDGGATVLVLSSFATGVTHLPIYDPETNPSGFLVTRIRPFTGACQLYWDDSNFSGGTVNIDGSLGTGHTWASNFGDVRTMNTWWNGYELDILNDFSFTIDFTLLPIEQGPFMAKKSSNNSVRLDWITFSEINNNYFTVERSNDSLNFIEIGEIKSKGNSNSIANYSFVDYSPIDGINYYRLKQTDFNGSYSYYSIIAINTKSTEIHLFPSIINSQTPLTIAIPENKSNYKIDIYNTEGLLVYQTSLEKETDEQKLELQLTSGIYYAKISNEGVSRTIRFIYN